ncbi:MAG: sigma 54-interacting transcriptional regulator [Deferrisomatales bacterium]|nr:sigma 54-interacting transcriptional regulator [Deferrisomatales bacterium]
MQNAELRRTQEDLELSRNTYAKLYDLSPIAYFTWDTRGMILDVNLAGERLVGADKRVLIGKSFANFVSDDESREVFSRNLQAVAGDSDAEGGEIRIAGSKGSVWVGWLQSARVQIADSRAPFILASIVDNTARQRMEDELQESHHTLEMMVSERTRELTEANAQLTQLLDERKKAEEELQAALVQIEELKDRLQAENIYLQKEIAREYNFDEIIGHSDALAYVFFQIEQVAPQDTTVLLLGETGTGKGVIARAIHRRSTRKDRPLVTVNCSALPANLIESELFGREKGAFTGANARQMGRFEVADGGTLFLDEIGEMPLELQVKLLRVLQEGEFERLGSPRTIKTNVRIIAASNRILEAEVRAGRFREDLFYRLSVFPITIPPLRQRTEDIPLLVNHFLARFNKKLNKRIETVSKETLGALQDYGWPGNVRELESVIERAAITTQGTALRVLDRFEPFRRTGEPPAPHEVHPLAEVEYRHILQALEKTGGRIEGAKGAATLLGLNPSTLRARMRKHGISARQRRSP